MTQQLLIDGYNLLHYAGYAKKRMRTGEFDKARSRLLKLLTTALTSAELARTTVVFDAQYLKLADRSPQSVQGIQVLFTPHGKQADDLIEHFLQTVRQPEFVRVISSDHRMRIAARQARAQFTDSDSFLVELEKKRTLRATGSPAAFTHEKKPPQKPKKKVELPEMGPESGNSEEWLKAFGGIDVVDIDQELQKETDTPRVSGVSKLKTGAKSAPRHAPGKPVSQPEQTKNPPAVAKSSASPTTSAPSAEEEVKPLKPGQGRIRDGQHRVVPGKPNQAPPPSQNQSGVPDDEVSFWELRVARMMNEMQDDDPR